MNEIIKAFPKSKYIQIKLDFETGFVHDDRTLKTVMGTYPRRHCMDPPRHYK